MPSNSLTKLENNLLIDVDRLIQSHSDLNHEGKGRRGLGHVTRSGVIMLCASWELYIEDLLLEGVDYFIVKTTDPSNLPLPVQKELSSAVKKATHELEPIKLAGDGWKTFYKDYANLRLKKFHTPKSNNINSLYRCFLGIENVSDCWSLGTSIIDNFVSTRGDIAHRGREAAYTRIPKLKIYRQQIADTAVEIDNKLCEYLRTNTPGTSRPWNQRSVNP